MRRLHVVTSHLGARSVPSRFRHASPFHVNSENVTIHPAAEGSVAHVHLCRPKALNALTLGMVQHMVPAYRHWLRAAAGLTNPDDTTWLPRAVWMDAAGEKAFCAGGDVVSIAGGGSRDDAKGSAASARAKDYPRRFFFEEYLLNYAIASLAADGTVPVGGKPGSSVRGTGECCPADADSTVSSHGVAPISHIAVLDGITMGGGVGLSIHGSHRIATERTMFAMPETAIGLFPDVGTSYRLPRLPVPGLGLYLALTGHRLKGADVVHAGIATHFIPSAGLPALREAILSPRVPFRSAEDIDAIVNQHCAQLGHSTSHTRSPIAPTDLDAVSSSVSTSGVPHYPSAMSLPPFSLGRDLAYIGKFFGQGSAATRSALSLVQALEGAAATASPVGDGDKAGMGPDREAEWAAATARAIRKGSPTSVCLTQRLLGLSAEDDSLAAAFAREYRLTQHVVVEHTASPDFHEGVRAVLVDKDGKPQWNPARMEDVDSNVVEKCFSAPAGVEWSPESELRMPLSDSSWVR
eukprot:TRINITY_DN22472_c0_g1_i1.p1 TRINITY_DN22472_c0_g1~~TRINITY_DN22472_c0_g1_i1.p1  ORF type:complete len:522 (+),score=94.33 TRINITY_DN22472_c0_g1_i1:49-1614(+)